MPDVKSNQTYKSKLQDTNMNVFFIIENTFFESSERNMVLRSVPIIILSFANSNCDAFSLSAPSTAALMAAIFTRFAKSVSKRNN